MKLSKYFIIIVLFFSVAGCKKNDIVYTKVGIKRLTVISFPASNSNGSSWDFALGTDAYPDLNFTISQSGTSNFLYENPGNSVFANTSVTSLPLAWASATYFYTNTNLSQKIDIDLWDEDGLSSDDYMGSVEVNFQNYSSGSNKYPNTITVSSGTLSFKLDLVWQ